MKTPPSSHNTIKSSSVHDNTKQKSLKSGPPSSRLIIALHNLQKKIIKIKNNFLKKFFHKQISKRHIAVLSEIDIIPQNTKSTKKRKHIEPKTWSNIGQLGEGKYGSVMETMPILTKKHFKSRHMILTENRVEKIQKLGESSKEIIKKRKAIITEEKLQTLNPEAPKIYGFEEFKSKKDGIVYRKTFMEKKLASLSKYLNIDLKAPYSEDFIANITIQLADQLATLHSKGVVHRDIKADNILLDNKGGAFLADYGLSEEVDSKGKVHNINGTPSHMPPELLETKTGGANIDIWSLGILMVSLSLGNLPIHIVDNEFKFNHSKYKTLINIINNHKFNSKHLKPLLLAMLEIDPKKRLSAHQVRNHPFVLDRDDYTSLQRKHNLLYKRLLSYNIKEQTGTMSYDDKVTKTKIKKELTIIQNKMLEIDTLRQ